MRLKRRLTPLYKNSRAFDFDRENAAAVAARLDFIMRNLLSFEEKHTARINKLHRAYEISARNLFHYIALLGHDLSPISRALSSLGFSSLGRSESHILAGIISVLKLLNQLLARPVTLQTPYYRQVTYAQGHSLLEAHTESLFGPPPAQRRVRIMVTFSRETAADYDQVRKLIENGMDCARINCAHDDKSVWEKMCNHVRRAERETGKQCKILMDLGGPKLRTGPLLDGPRVLKIHPARDAFGIVVKPATVWLPDTPDAVCPRAAATLPTLDGWSRRLRRGDVLVFSDARKKERRLLVTQRRDGGCIAQTEMTGYIVPFTRLNIVRNGNAIGSAGIVGELPAKEESLTLQSGDTVMLTKPGNRRTADPRSRTGRRAAPPAISCSLPEVFADVKIDERVFFDDGKIAGIIESASRENILVKIIAAGPRGGRLRADKGINLPDSDLSVSGFTEKDKTDLAFIARYADIVALSFVRDASDVTTLQRHLARMGCSNLGIVLKIETRQAVKRLPSLLLSAMASHPIGVMIARGDLAIELGFDNLAEAQDEILCMCEAAHVPTIWATQVLENLAKSGIPSRAEISDAAMGVRAECVMLNKGEFILNAVTMLDAILKRMQLRSLDKIDYRKSRIEGRRFIGGIYDDAA